MLDYFPAYELIAAPPYKGMFYEANMRTVSKAGVTFVMDAFFTCLEQTFRDMPAVSKLAPNIELAREFWSNVLSARNSMRDPA